ncbi:PK beta-barrel-protein domain-containing protein-like protein [Xylariomycetidae sp. FL0641]|nr:PK beta-barrel-protein domain-containing protein-like protein [Xylariomycetidae sp. FL0641]
MACMEAVDLFAPVERDTILEVRTSKMKTMPGLKIESGIDKGLRTGRIAVDKTGLEADEHDLTFHGGADKALHGYCSSHYPGWRAEYPEAAARFVPGAFGENLVLARMNERNVCIGDIVRITPPSSAPTTSSAPAADGTATTAQEGGGADGEDGGDDGVLLQVSLPRPPCFKLNHRFQLRNFAPRTAASTRTGWYYRVLRGGRVGAGDAIAVVARPHPDWPVARVQEYLHRTQDNEAANTALAAVPALGPESRNAFAARRGEGEKEAEVWSEYSIGEKTTPTPRITSFVLEEPPAGKDAEQEEADGDGGGRQKRSTPAPHVRLRPPQRPRARVLGRRRRHAPALRARRGAGAAHSAFLHAAPTGTVVCARGRATRDGAAGVGVGITGVLARRRAVHRECAPRAVRGRNARVYVCGGRGGCATAALPPGGPPRRGVRVRSRPWWRTAAGREGPEGARADETLLQVLLLRREVPDASSCEVGNCGGTCKVARCGGGGGGSSIGARRSWRRRGRRQAMLSCVSRGVGRIGIEV